MSVSIRLIYHRVAEPTNIVFKLHKIQLIYHLTNVLDWPSVFSFCCRPRFIVWSVKLFLIKCLIDLWWTKKYKTKTKTNTHCTPTGRSLLVFFPIRRRLWSKSQMKSFRILCISNLHKSTIETRLGPFVVIPHAIDSAEELKIQSTHFIVEFERRFHQH